MTLDRKLVLTMCRQGGRQSYCLTRTLSNWTNSPRPYRSPEEPSRHCSSSPPSCPELNTITPPFLHLSQLFLTPGHQRRMQRCQKKKKKKKWCSRFISQLFFFSTSNLTRKLFVLVVTSSVTTTVKNRVQYHSRLLMSTLLVFPHNPQALVFQSSHQSDVVGDQGE